MFRVTTRGIEPKRRSKGACGYDLYCPLTQVIKAGKTIVIDLHVMLTLPENTVGLIKDRSSIAAKKHLAVLAGVIDQDFEGSLKVILTNLSKRPVTLEQNTAIAQILIIPIVILDSQYDDYDINNPRGVQGFGSTDKPPAYQPHVKLDKETQTGSSWLGRLRSYFKKSQGANVETNSEMDTDY